MGTFKITLKPGDRHIFIKAKTVADACRIALLKKPITYNDIMRVEEV
jgi:hypothetical protein